MKPKLLALLSLVASLFGGCADDAPPLAEDADGGDGDPVPFAAIVGTWELSSVGPNDTGRLRITEEGTGEFRVDIQLSSDDKYSVDYYVTHIEVPLADTYRVFVADSDSDEAHYECVLEGAWLNCTEEVPGHSHFETMMFSR